MYEDLVNTLLYDAGWLEQGITQTEHDIAEHLKKAADAIEELQKALDAVNDAHNEGYDVGYWAGRRDYEPKWIPVTERLPEEGVSVQICFLSQGGKAQAVSERFVDNRNQSYWSGLCGMKPTHWMPLPEPPKEEA